MWERDKNVLFSYQKKRLRKFVVAMVLFHPESYILLST